MGPNQAITPGPSGARSRCHSQQQGIRAAGWYIEEHFASLVTTGDAFGHGWSPVLTWMEWSVLCHVPPAIGKHRVMVRFEDFGLPDRSFLTVDLLNVSPDAVDPEVHATIDELRGIVGGEEE